MKRLLLWLALVLPAVPAWTATYYLDGACPTPGNGTGGYTSTCDGTAAGNPATDMATAIALLTAQDDILNVRGVHSAHGSCPGDTNGWYRTDKWTISNTAGASGHPIIIQANGYTTTGAGTQEAVYLESVKTLTAGDWTQCTWDGSACDCDATHLNVQIGAGGSTACGETWWHTKTGDGSNRTYWGTKPDRTITPRRQDLSGMTSQYDASRAPQCLGGANAGLDCGSDGDCPSSTCNKTILVRWGSSLPTDPSVNFSNNGNILFFSGSADYITVRGFKIRRGIRAAFYAPSGTSNITLQDNELKYFNDGSGGSSRPVEIDSALVIDILDNEIAYSACEPLHITTFTDGTVSGNIRRNYIHDIGDTTALGTATRGTPNCTTFTNDASSGNPTSGSASPWDTGDNTGLVVDSNIFQNCNEQDPTKGAYGIYLESAVKNAVFTNNIISGVAACIVIRPFHSTPINGGINGINTNTFYNNVCYGAIAGVHDVSGSCFNLNADGQASPNAAINGNKFYNNTCVDLLDVCIQTGTGSGLGNTTTNTFANNICVKASLSSPTNFIANHTTAGLTINKNVIWSGKTSGQCGVVNNATVNCGAAGCELCSNPLFGNAANHDYHIQTASPAKDAGTLTGMPGTRIVDIYNTIAASHGLPSYADGNIASGTVDIGVDEFASGTSVTMTISKTDAPDPVVPANNITYTLAYANTSSTDATGVVISDTVPVNTTFVSATAGGAFGGGIVTWNIGTVPANSSSSVQMVVSVTSPLSNGTIISNATYSIFSNEQGTVSGATDTTTVTSAPFLILGKSDSPDPVLAGSNITYTISYSNTGTSGATGVVITDTVPVNTTFVSATGGGSLGGGVVTWTIGAVNAGASGSVQMVVQVGAGVANGATITNQTYAMASNELSTLTGTPITSTVFIASPTTPDFIRPITQRQNSWSATQTHVALPNADIVESSNAGQWVRGQASELLTLSTSGTTTDTSANLLPANSIIEAVVGRVTSVIGTATNWQLGDAAQSARFTGVQTGLSAGTTVVGLNHADPTVASSNLGPVQTSAAKVRVTTTGTPSSGAIRITVFYRQFVPPGS